MRIMVKRGRTMEALPRLGRDSAAALPKAVASSFRLEIWLVPSFVLFKNFIRPKHLCATLCNKAESAYYSYTQSIATTYRLMKNPVLLAALATREKTGLTLQEIAERTKISRRHLESLENGEFLKLPGGVYTTSYIRQYARAIGFDEFELLGAYHAETAALQTLPLIGKVQNPSVRGFRPLFQ